MLGHTVDKCYNPRGYPPGYKPKARGMTNTSEGFGDGSAPMNNLTAKQFHQIIQSLSNSSHPQAHKDIQMTSTACPLKQVPLTL